MRHRTTNGTARVLGSVFFAVGIGVIATIIAPGGGLQTFAWSLIGGILVAVGLDMIIGGSGGEKP